MSDDVKITKGAKRRILKLAGIVVLVGVIAGAGAAGGYTYGSKGADTETAAEAAEANEVRNTIVVEEDAEGKILINGKGFEPNGVTLGEGRVFLERVPVNCKETVAAMRALMTKGNIAPVLNPDQRYEFELLNVLAKDVCSYEEYRNLLVTGLSEFLYTTPGPTAEETPETTVPGEESTGTNEAGDQPATTAPEDQ